MLSFWTRKSRKLLNCWGSRHSRTLFSRWVPEKTALSMIISTALRTKLWCSSFSGSDVHDPLSLSTRLFWLFSQVVDFSLKMRSGVGVISAPATSNPRTTLDAGILESDNRPDALASLKRLCPFILDCECLGLGGPFHPVTVRCVRENVGQYLLVSGVRGSTLN